MEQMENSRKGKHLNREERMDIAAALGRHRRTIEREPVRGRVLHKDSQWREKSVYSSDRGQGVHDLNATARGPDLKLGRHHDMAQFIRCRIVEHRESPDVAAFRLRQAGRSGAVCTRTLYRYIDQGVIPGVSNQSLWEKRKRASRQPRRSRRTIKRLAHGAGIRQRPSVAATRQEFGHWEMDWVAGPARGSGAVLLTLTERKHRQVILRKLPDKTRAGVLKALRRIERFYGPTRFRLLFKSIPVDNGSEFLDFKALEASGFSSRPRTRIFYAHPVPPGSGAPAKTQTE